MLGSCPLRTKRGFEPGKRTEFWRRKSPEQSLSLPALSLPGRRAQGVHPSSSSMFWSVRKICEKKPLGNCWRHQRKGPWSRRCWPLLYPEAPGGEAEIALKNGCTEASSDQKKWGKEAGFCQKHCNWTEEDWSKVMYSNESTFCCVRATRKRVRRRVGSDRFDSRYTMKTVKHPASLIVWACFSGSYGRGGIFFLPPNVTMNGERYQQVMEDHLLPFMEMHGAVTSCRTLRLVTPQRLRTSWRTSPSKW